MSRDLSEHLQSISNTRNKFFRQSSNFRQKFVNTMHKNRLNCISHCSSLEHFTILQ